LLSMRTTFKETDIYLSLNHPKKGHRLCTEVTAARV
jgi:hypothetical protein